MYLLTSPGLVESPSALPPRDGTLRVASLVRCARAHYEAGRVQEADILCCSILREQPEQPEALQQLGIIAHQFGQSKAAIDLFEQAIMAAPDNASFYLDCGEAYRANGDYQSALARYEHALALAPDLASAHYNVGLALHELGRTEEAVLRYERALATQPDLAEALNNLGVANHELAGPREAIDFYERALAINIYHAEAHSNIGIALKAVGNPQRAVAHHQMAMRLVPSNPAVHIAFTHCLRDLILSWANDDLRGDLLRCLSFDGIDPQDLSYPVASLVARSPAFLELAAYLGQGWDGTPIEPLLTLGLRSVYSDPLFLALLRHVIIRHPLIERVLTATRRGLLALAIDRRPGFQADGALVSFVCALASQCFSNEFVYSVSEVEASEVRRLEELVTCGSENDPDLPARVTVLACYVTLGQLGHDELFLRLLGTTGNANWAALVAQQITEPRDEQRLGREIRSVGQIQDATSCRVRGQYEASPYPRWLRADRLRGQSLRRIVRASLPHAPLEWIPEVAAPEILVAGCGTGQHAIHRALGCQDSRVLGVDLSLSSLAYAERKAREIGLTNAKFAHADLLNISLLGQRFDLVECIGVLHHLNNPLAGWRTLASCLRSGGLMRVGLYSEIARTEIAAAQSFVAANGYPASANGIRRFRRDALEMPEGSAVRRMTEVVDFYTISEARDLLFHVHEVRLTLKQIAEMLDALHLRVVGLELKEPAHFERYRARYPSDQLATSLLNWHEYELENPNTFIGLYIIWAQAS